MPTEMVLLCDVEPTAELVASAVERLAPGAALLDVDDGRVLQWVDEHGDVVLSLFAAQRIEVRMDADRAVAGGTGDYCWWADMTTPYGDATEGWAMAYAVAETVGGRAAPRV
ncbi:MAG: hypothetical protein FWE61_06410 [Micrococcales bacterium]|nr:hypothetical protein [Micrococcales bacterium]